MTRALDPKDRWLFAEPLSDSELNVVRLKAEVGSMDVRGRPVGEFNCFACKLQRRCVLAYDSWNTNGDCLLDK
jgi:hypothetical protein